MNDEKYKYRTTDDCNMLRGETKELISGKEGLQDQMKEMREGFSKINMRLSRIEWTCLGIAAAYTFFIKILPTLLKIGTAIGKTK